MNLTPEVVAARQARRRAGAFVTYEATDVSTDMSFLEMLDVLNERSSARGEQPIAFDHDCREGICGSCGVDDQRRRPRPARAHHRLPAPHAHFQDGDVVTIEPWRAAAFPVIKDLVVDRSRLRPDHRSRRLHLASAPAAPRGQRHPGPEA